MTHRLRLPLLIALPLIFSPAAPAPREAKVCVAHGAIRRESFLSAADWIAAGDRAGASFGLAVAGVGDVNGDGFPDVLVGAPHDDDADRGRVFLYLGSASGLSSTPAWSKAGPALGAQFGSFIAPAGDVDGDGRADVLLGSPSWNGHGAVFVYRGTNDGLAASALAILEGDEAGSGFGGAVSAAGDVNGDGYDDVLVGAPLSGQGRGTVFLFSGSATGPVASWSASGEAPGHFGGSVSAAGDVNADGFDDFIVGAPERFDGGRAFVFLGGPAGPPAAPSWSAGTDFDAARFGFSVGSAGDVNGDGFSDVIVGAPFLSDPEPEEGHAFVYLGSAAGLGPGAAWVGQCNQPHAGFGTSVAGAGDVNGDGLDDVLAGIPRHDEGSVEQGAAFLYLGSSGSLPLNPDWGGLGEQAAAHFGTSVSAAGDVNDDGFADLVVGAPDQDGGDSGAGRAFFYQGGPGCAAPVLPVSLHDVRLVEATHQVVLDFDDPNPSQPGTGYDIDRTANPALPPEEWTRVAGSVNDSDPATPGIQWMEIAEPDPSLGTALFYQITAVNGCGRGPR
jgi:hypothetical protein